MKKVYLIILLTLAIFVSGCSLIEKSTEIELINLANGEMNILEDGSESAQLILRAINTRDKAEEDISGLKSYEVILKKEPKTENYKLSFDLDNKLGYVTKGENTYKVDINIAKKLLLNENFYYLYIEKTLYKSYLDYNGKEINPEVNYNWSYKDIEGHFIQKEGTIKAEDNDPIKVSEGDKLAIAYEIVPDSQVVRIYSGDKLLSTGRNLQELLDNIKGNGEYTVESNAQWLMRENSDFYGNSTLKFTIKIDKTANLVIGTKENYPGNILVVAVENLNGDESLSLKTDAVKTMVDMYKYKEKAYFLCPIDLYTEPGEYDLRVIVNEGTNKEYVIENILNVKSKSFKTQYLTVSEEMNENNNDNVAIYEFAQLVKPARTESVPEKLWEGTFIMPVEGELTTDFAEIRYVNNEQSSSRHSGLDLATSKGTEIKAPNNGVVTFAMEGLLSPGNTVVIDHGMGIFTSYYHLDTIKVEKGQKVSKGTVIGTVGNTGFSTGPHLHYAVSIYNTYINPYQTLSGIID